MTRMTLTLMDRTARAEYERELDLALDGSFPASDPLPWTLGVAIEPGVSRPEHARAPAASATDDDASPSHRR